MLGREGGRYFLRAWQFVKTIGVHIVKQNSKTAIGRNFGQIFNKRFVKNKCLTNI